MSESISTTTLKLPSDKMKLLKSISTIKNIPMSNILELAFDQYYKNIKEEIEDYYLGLEIKKYDTEDYVDENEFMKKLENKI